MSKKRIWVAYNIMISIILLSGIIYAQKQSQNVGSLQEFGKYKIQNKESTFLIKYDNLEIELQGSFIYEDFKDGSLKYSINFDGLPKRDGYYRAIFNSNKTIKKLGDVHYLIGDKVHYFNPVFKWMYNDSKTGEPIYSDSQTYVEQINDYLLILYSKEKIWYPEISTWNNASLTYYWEGYVDITDPLYDYGNSSNNNSFDLVAGSPNTESGLKDNTYSLNITDGTTSYDSINAYESDFGGGSSFELSAVLRVNDCGGDQVLFSADNNDIRMKFGNCEMETYINTDGIDCNQFYGWYNSEFDKGSLHNFSWVYDGDSINLLIDGVSKDDRACSGTINAISDYARLFKDNSATADDLQMYCVGIWSQDYLTTSERSNFFQGCYGETEGSPCNESLTNTSWSSWGAMESCKSDQSFQENRSRVSHDQNNCGFENVTHWEYRDTPCCYQLTNPTNFINTSQTNQTIALSWENVVGSEMYQIYNFTVNFWNDSSTPYTIEGLWNNTEYCLNMTARNDSCIIKESNFSNSICTFTSQNDGIVPWVNASCDDGDYDCRLTEIEEGNRMNWISLIYLGLLIGGALITINYNPQIGVPMMMLGTLLNIYWGLYFIGLGTFFNRMIGYGFVAMILPLSIGIFYMKSKRNRVIA